MKSLVNKRCDCAEARWPKCPHPWYLAQFRWQGKAYAPNLTRHAQLFTASKELTTKTEAEALAEVVRTAIRGGAYVSAKVQQTTAPATVEPGQTLTECVTAFDTAVITADPKKRKTTKAGDRSNLKCFAAFTPTKTEKPLGDRPINLITLDHLIAFRNSPRLLTAANSTWAKYRTNIGQLFAWAKAVGHLTVNPFDAVRPDQKKILQRGKGAKRSRRVYADEETALLRAASRTPTDHVGIRLYAIIIAAIETGMRKGELLALQWADVHLAERSIWVRAEEVGASKTGSGRSVPISQRLLDELELLKLDPTGARWPRSAYVFGDAIGDRIEGIDKAWETAVLRAYGYTVRWVGTALSPESREQLAAINLHFHDLRHEAGSRWLESKQFDLAEVSEMLGHATIEQTATYLHAARGSAKKAMTEYDAYCKQQAQLAKAAGDPNSDPNAHKLHTNRKRGSAATTGPRLVKGSKSRGSM